MARRKQTRRNVVGTVYLIHFQTKFSHVQHYVGWTEGAVEQRIDDHRSGCGSKLMAAVTSAGIPWEVIKTWQGQTRAFERKLHNRHGSRVCPLCLASKLNQQSV